MKKWIIIALLALTPIVSAAQYGNGLGIGARAGLNLADFTGSTGKGRPGFVGGVFLDYNISRFGFELGVNFAQQGSLGVVQSGVENYAVDYMFDYTNAHLLVKYQIFNGFRIYLGPQVNYLVSATEKRNGINSSVDYINKWDVGIKAGVGFTFKFGLDISASYTHGFYDMFQTSRTAYNSVFAISVGWRFSLMKKNKR